MTSSTTGTQCENLAPISNYPCTLYQFMPALILGSTASAVSTLSSLSVVYIIVKSQISLSSIYHRIMMGMCLMDIIASIAMSLVSIPMPTDMLYDHPFNYGTFTTCSIQGFIFIFGVTGSLMYVCGLCIYYYCVLKKYMSEEIIKRRVEPAIHIIAWGSSIFLSSLGYGLGLYNPSNHTPWCSYAVYPYECIDDEDVECLRGSITANTIFQSLVGAVTITAIVVVTVFMVSIILWYTRRKQLSRDASDLRERGERNELRVTLVKQALMYIFAFFISWIWVPITIFFPYPIVLNILCLIFFPIQGFFNAAIFYYDKVFKIKMQSSEDDNISTWEALRILLFDQSKVKEIQFTGISRVEKDRNKMDSAHGDKQFYNESSSKDNWSKGFLRKDDGIIPLPLEIPASLDCKEFDVAFSNEVDNISNEQDSDLRLSFRNEVDSTESNNSVRGLQCQHNEISSMDLGSLSISAGGGKSQPTKSLTTNV